MIRWIDTDEGSLDCLCAVGDVIDDTLVGPDVFCDSECHDSEACGGKHTFQSGVTISYFSIYCIPRGHSSGNDSSIGTSKGNASTTEDDLELRIDTGRDVVKVGNIYVDEQGPFSVLS